MRIVNFSDARNSLKDVIDQVVADADVTVISRRDAPDAVVMSLDHYSSLMETVRFLSSPANAAHLARLVSSCVPGRHTSGSCLKWTRRGRPPMRKITFTIDAWEDYIYWQKQDKRRRGASTT